VWWRRRLIESTWLSLVSTLPWREEVRISQFPFFQVERELFFFIRKSSYPPWNFLRKKRKWMKWNSVYGFLINPILVMGQAHQQIAHTVPLLLNPAPLDRSDEMITALILFNGRTSRFLFECARRGPQSVDNYFSFLFSFWSISLLSHFADRHWGRKDRKRSSQFPQLLRHTVGRWTKEMIVAQPLLIK